MSKDTRIILEFIAFCTMQIISDGNKQQEVKNKLYSILANN